MKFLIFIKLKFWLVAFLMIIWMLFFSLLIDNQPFANATQENDTYEFVGTIKCMTADERIQERIHEPTFNDDYSILSNNWKDV